MRSAIRITLALALLMGACVSPERDARPPEPDADGAPIVAGFEARNPSTIALSFHRIARTLVDPVAVASAFDGTGRLFIVEQAGRIRIWKPGSGLRSTPYLSIRGRVRAGGEQGMLGLAFHPRFKTNRFFFVTYTDGQGDLRIVRLRADGGYRSNRADASTHRIILQVPHRTYSNHNAGQLNFGSKYLYVSTGDGGGGGDPDGNAQRLGNLRGKILRLDIDRTCGSKRYCSPSTNPFYGRTPGKGEIYHYGLRNPWRWSFDRVTNAMWIADVGQSAWEEVSLGARGRKGVNFGWDCREGRHPFESNPYCNGARFQPPLREYANSSGRCAIIGGYVYRGSADPELRGMYVYADHCSREVWALAKHDGRWRNARVGTAPGNISAFGERQDGELVAVTLDGRLFRIRARIE